MFHQLLNNIICSTVEKPSILLPLDASFKRVKVYGFLHKDFWTLDNLDNVE